MSSFKSRYGLDFPAEMPDPLIALRCWKHWREPEYSVGKIDPVQCFWDGIYTLVPPEAFIRHKWSEQHVADWTLEDFIITWGCAASGKATTLDTQVYTPEGPIPMGELKVGDEVVAQDGWPSRIIKVHEVGTVDEYCVEFSGGARVFCSGDHLWEVEGRGGDWRRAHVVTTDWLSKQPAGRYKVPLCEPVYFRAHPVRIDPYVLGALLGDGSLGGRSGKGYLAITSADRDVLDYFSSKLAPGYRLRHYSRYSYGLNEANPSRGRRNDYNTALRYYGLWGKTAETKFVPRVYLYNSAPARRELLSGLLDTDGTCSKTGAISFSSISKQLAEDVRWLVYSLGGLASISTKTPAYTYNGERRLGQLAYTVSISMRDAAGLFKCARKQLRVKTAGREVASKMISSVVKTGRAVPMRCITIDHPRGLYLVNDFTATHNSNDYGLLTLVDWMVDPAETVSILASTSLAMLKIRSYESVLRYFHIIQNHAPWKMPGKLRKTDSAIILDEDDELGHGTDKASIRGVAVAEGSDQEARSKLAGAHLPYVRLGLDELSQMRPAAMQVRTNLSIGAKSFKLFGLCNPDSFIDLAAVHSVPLDSGGFASLDPDAVEEWRSQYGKIRRHDGFKSPAITEPDGAKKYPFLLTSERLKQILDEHEGNTDDGEVWTMVRGFPPTQGRRQTLITMAEILQAGAMEDVAWYSQPAVTVLGVDPAFSASGNRAVMQAADVGFDKDMQVKISFREPKVIRLEASSKTPILEQVGASLNQYMTDDLMVPAALCGVDDSATQSVADHMAIQYHVHVQRFVSNAKPSLKPMSVSDRQTAKDRYHDQSIELWAAVAAFIRAGQIRNFPARAAHQLVNRPTEKIGRLHRLQSKKVSRREGNELANDSPDDMDACAYAVGVLRFVLNLVAGCGTIPSKYAGDPAQPAYNRSGLATLARKHDLDSRAYEG